MSTDLKSEFGAAAQPLTGDENRIVRWIGEVTGGRVVAFRRHARWRPMYFVDVDCGDEKLELCARQARADIPQLFSLEHEMVFQRTLSEYGIPVPRVYGWLDSPQCYLMDRVPGVAHLEGLSPERRDALMRDYIATLAKIHSLPADVFRRNGIIGAKNPRESHMTALRQCEKVYRKHKVRPDAFAEFGLKWLKRHPIQEPERECPVVWDSGQFHQVEGRLISLVDLELGHLGDPMNDLGSLRMRDSIIGFGDLESLYRHYESVSGYPVDRDAVHFHHLFFALTNALANNAVLASPPPRSNYMIYLQWTNETNRYALEAIAEDMGMELPEIQLPEPEDSPAGVAFDQLVNFLGQVETGDDVLRYELRNAFRLSRHLARWDEIGRQVVDADLDDIAELLGKRPASWREGEAALEKFVAEDNGRRDEALIHLFNRRLQRAQALNGPPGSAIAYHHRLQPQKR